MLFTIGKNVWISIYLNRSHNFNNIAMCTCTYNIPGFSHWDECGASFGTPQSYEQYIILSMLFFCFFLGLAWAHPKY